MEGQTSNVRRLAPDVPAVLSERVEDSIVSPDPKRPERPATDPGAIVDLSSEDVERIVQAVAGGAENIQDIYPLAPLQEGILFHHMMGGRGDAYVVLTLFEFQSRSRVEAFINALQRVIDRHDILRASMLWEQVSRPVQVIHRRATLSVEEFELSPTTDPLEQFAERMKPEQQSLDVGQAPLMRLQTAQSRHGEQWYGLLQMHHLVCDAQSLRVVMAEVGAFLVSGTAALPEPMQYRRHVEQALARAQADDAAAFFTAKLRDIDTPTAPFGLLDVYGIGGRVREARRTLDPEVSRYVRRQARHHRATPATLFHAAWAMVVAKTSGRDDVVFGTVLLGRLQLSGGTQHRVGMFLNTLPLRLNLTGLSVRALVKQAQCELLELLGHEQASLAVAQRCSGIAGSAPLFGSLLNYVHASHESEDQAVIAPGIRRVRSQVRTNYPISVSVVDLQDDFALAVQTDERVDAECVAGYLQMAVQSLLEALDRAPEALALCLSILPAAERYQVIEAFNASAPVHPQEKLLQQLFEEQVARTPHGVAVTEGGRSITYANLNARANQLARCLRDKGVVPDQLVGICAERTLEMVIGLLAILKAGGAYVPLDPNYPADRLEYMLEDAVPKVLVVQEALRARFADTTAEVVVLNAYCNGSSPLDSGNLDARGWGQHAHHLAYVIYTSGSTGKPKGTMVEHKNVTRLFAATDHWFKFNADDVWTLFHSYAFDFSVWELWGALLHGGRLVVVPYLTARSPREFYNLVCEERVTVLNQTPSAFAQLIDAQSESELKADALRAVIFGGEALELRALRPWIKRNGTDKPRLINMYGITETTVHVTYRPLTEEEIDSDQCSPVGRPIPDLRTYVLNQRFEPVPIGVTGELYVGGAGVARGYLNRPDLSAERFVVDPYSKDPGARMYKSGDLGRWRPDGALEYLGRNDQQVKIRGFRIELGEIETQLVRLEGIKDAVVIAWENAPGDKRLVAYIIPTDRGGSAGLRVEAIRTSLKATLPEYMIPSAFVSLERLPLTSNGKLDRRALPVPEPGRCTSWEYEAPRGEIEKAVAGIWQALLRVDRVGRQDNFFELGGHSLLIVRMMQRLRRLGLSVDVRRVFENPALADLAGVLGREKAVDFPVPPNLIPAECEALTPEMLPLVSLQAQHIERIVRTVPGGAANVQDIYPLTPLQEGILFHYVLDEQGADAYARTILLALPSREKLEEFVRSLQQVIDRHDILRTAVQWEQLPQPVQVVYRRATVQVASITLAPSRNAVEELQERMTFARHRLNLRRAPLVELQIAADPRSQQWYVLLHTHHLICDNASMEILLTEIAAFFDGLKNVLPAPPYRTHVAEALAHGRKGDAEAFFRQKLAGIVEPTAPFGLSDVYGDGRRMRSSGVALSFDVARRLRLQARRIGVSVTTMFHAAWALVVARTSGRDDVVYGTVLLGRMHGSAGAEPILGMFINTLPLRLSLQELSARGLVEQTQRELVDLMSYEHAPLAVAQRCSGIVGSVPLFSTLLNYRHSMPSVAESWSKLGISVVAASGGTSYPITLSVDDLDEGFALHVESGKQADPDRILGYVSTAVESLIQALERAPEMPALAVEVLPEAERSEVLSVFNNTQMHYPRDRFIHELFEAQSERIPDAPAVICEDQVLTYSELNAFANQLACYLREQGVCAGEYIPIQMPRCTEMLIAQLAVLKCGGVYVPLDLELPPERRAFIIGDCAARRIVAMQSAGTDLQMESIQWIDYSTAAQAMAASSALNVNLPRDAAHPAYVMYTSGSTGLPKGVIVPHHAVNHLVINGGYVTVGPDDCIVHASNPAFDASTFEVWAALLNGARVFIAAQKLVLDPPMFARALQKHEVTVLWLTSGLFSQYAEAMSAAFAQLRYLIVGGDVVDPNAIRRVLSDKPPKHILNGYGPTECTTFSTTYRIDTQPQDGTTIPIGRPISNTQIYILDGRLHPVPVGVTGEIYIGGAGVAVGYLNRPQLTAERFVANPFGGDPDARLYRTGDLGCWRADGVVEYLGRNDQQVKVRGFRIELGEIEARLSCHEWTREAVVVALESGPAQKRLVAYLTLRQPPGPDGNVVADTLRSWVAAALPEYMLPSAFVVLESLPLTRNGKVDRSALPAPGVDSYVHNRYEAPQGEIEEMLAQTWSQVLDVTRPGRNDNFFELGGHSLLGMRLVARIAARSSIQLPGNTIFRHPTISRMARFLETFLSEGPIPPAASEVAFEEGRI